MTVHVLVRAYKHHILGIERIGKDTIVEVI